MFFAFPYDKIIQYIYILYYICTYVYRPRTQFHLLFLGFWASILWVKSSKIWGPIWVLGIHAWYLILGWEKRTNHDETKGDVFVARAWKIVWYMSYYCMKSLGDPTTPPKTISIGNTSSNHWFSRDIRPFSGKYTLENSLLATKNGGLVQMIFRIIFRGVPF